MNKKGFLLVWAMVLILMIGISMSVAINSRDGTVTAYNKVKVYENAYHHAIVIENWAKTYVKKYGTNMEGWMNDSHQLHNKLITDGKFTINGHVGDDDGKINLYGLMVESDSTRRIYEQIMNEVFEYGVDEKINEIKDLLMSGKKVIGSGLLGEHENIFSDRILDKDMNTVAIYKMPEGNKININTLNEEVAKTLFGIDKDQLVDFKEQGPYKNIAEVIQYIEIKEHYRNIIKFDSLFYYVDGSIIQDNNTTDFRIELTKEDDIIKTSYRYVQ